MNAPLKRRLAIGGVVAVAAAGGGAAFAARGHQPRQPSTSGGRAFVDAGPARPMHGRRGIFSAVLTYLGLTPDRLRTQLEAGKTLAQVADATPGKSAAGLVDALVAAAKQQLAAAVSSGRLTQGQADRIGGDLQQRIAGLVNGKRPSGPPPFRGGHGPRGAVEAAAGYLGLSPQTLAADMRAGKTLAQVADATPGKSAAGLVAALVAHEKQELAAAVSAGRVTQAQADRISASLQRRVTALVNGTFRKHGGQPRGAGANV